MTLRLLLLQAREPDDPMRLHEHECFVARSGLEPDQIATHDLLGGPPPLRDVLAYDALLMGGSGEFLVSRGNQPRFEPLLDTLREVVSRGHPTFAACYGFQAMVHALGGEIVYDPDNTEVGTFEVTLTDAGRRDELFDGSPASFLAQQGHKDRATRLPERASNLAASDRCPHRGRRGPR